MVTADIQPVTEQWNLTNSPAQLRAGDKWVLHSSGGRDSSLSIQQASGNSFVVEASEPNFPNAANVSMGLMKSAGQYAVNSLTVTAKSHAFHIAFSPALPLPTPTTQGQDGSRIRNERG